MKSWKISDNQIDAIIKSGKVQEQIDILSDYSGYVMKRNIELGDHVMEGMKLFEIANIDVVWVMFEAYESDIPWINKGDIIDFTITATPGKTYHGKITYIDPFVSASTRVAKVRVEVKNPSHRIIPEMYANGIVKAKIANENDVLMIPKSAVLWTGKRSVVYVKVPHEKIISFVYREIILGVDLGNFYIVNNGLKKGEIVATNGVFRIDASAQLMGQKSMMNPDGGITNHGGHAGMDMSDKNDKKDDVKSIGTGDVDIMIDKAKINKKFKEQIGSVVTDYIVLKNTLVNDDAIKAINQAEKVQRSLEKVDMLLLLGDAHNIWMSALRTLNNSLETIQNNKSINAQRKAFGVLGKTLSDIISDFGVVTANKKPLYLEFCPMADDNKGSYWLSYDKEISNPFFGQSMLTCGEVKKIY